MPTQPHLKRRQMIIALSAELGLKDKHGKTPTSESQLLTAIIIARADYGLDWPHKILEMIEKNKVSK